MCGGFSESVSELRDEPSQPKPARRSRAKAKVTSRKAKRTAKAAKV